MKTDQVWRRGDSYPADWPEWLRAAGIGWCRVEITEGGGVVWHSGTWRDGEWHGGTWHSGEWCGGTWYDGEWHDGEWYGGHWRNGTWHEGEWYDGEEWRTGGPPVPLGEKPAR